MDRAISEIPMVVLAAGYGSRIRSEGLNGPKPLTPVLGISLLERTLITGARAGVKSFFVVVGYEKEIVAGHAVEVATRAGLNVTVVESLLWQLGNGASATAPAEIIKSPFFLTMCDHIFDAEILKRLHADEDGSAICRIAVDRFMDRVFDLKEATLVSLKDDIVIDIGKGIPAANGVDTGFFLCQPDFFDVLKRALKQGKYNLSEAIKSHLQSQRVKIADVSGLFWHDVDTVADLEYAERILREGLTQN